MSGSGSSSATMWMRKGFSGMLTVGSIRIKIHKVTGIRCVLIPYALRLTTVFIPIERDKLIHSLPRTMLLQYALLSALTIVVESAESSENGSIINFHVGFDNQAPIEIQDGRRRNDERHALRIRNDHLTKIQSDTGNLRIRDGNATDTQNFPYMAAIIINGRLWCAGAIVDENWVLTAAHCLNYVLHVAPLKTLSQYVKVRVGSSKAHEGGTVVDVAGAVRHPKFEEEPVPHADVALLKLSHNLKFSQFVNLIKIYEARIEPYAQSFVVVTGWGATRGSDTAFRDPTSDLLTSRLKVRSLQYCVDAYQLVHGFQFTKDFFCAALRKGARDACLFDAGAPAILKNRLMGVMSFGPERCGHEFQPAVFVKAFYFRDFVKTTIASYKTTADLIAAMQEVDPGHMQPQVVELEAVPDFELEKVPLLSPAD